MLTIEDESFGGVPALHIYDMNEGRTPLPTMLYWHGFSSAKEHNLDFAYQLAKKGIRVVLPEARHHGERREGLTEKQRLFKFWSIVIEGLQDTQSIRDSLEEQQLIKDSRLFTAGTSMGGILTCGALAAFPWIKGGAVMMGNPAWESYARQQIKILKEQGTFPISDEKAEQEIQQLLHYDLSQQPALLGDRPLFFWHGREDNVVPYEDSYAFYEKIKQTRLIGDDTIMYHLEEKAMHKVSREGMLAMADWTVKHI
ncbi:prolyl oligopeptidase family serine peptidase [Salibacterium salarium]|nr:prolyl oligopeptidase family serine peptidase [Salibacterium salarium]